MRHGVKRKENIKIKNNSEKKKNFALSPCVVQFRKLFQLAQPTVPAVWSNELESFLRDSHTNTLKVIAY